MEGSTRYFCHQCEIQLPSVSEHFECIGCGSTFVEIMNCPSPVHTPRSTHTAGSVYTTRPVNTGRLAHTARPTTMPVVTSPTHAARTTNIRTAHSTRPTNTRPSHTRSAHSPVLSHTTGSPHSTRTSTTRTTTTRTMCPIHTSSTGLTTTSIHTSTVPVDPSPPPGAVNVHFIDFQRANPEMGHPERIDHYMEFAVPPIPRRYRRQRETVSQVRNSNRVRSNPIEGGSVHNRRQAPSSSDQSVASNLRAARRPILQIDQLVSEFMNNIGQLHGMPSDAPIVYMDSPGDYAFNNEGIDAVVTQLLNQIDSAGPPPLPKDQIESLPVINITEEQVTSNLQCSVCWDNFILAENVRQLPCEHIYHEICINPWLELHGTCPVCRKLLNDDDDDDDDDDGGDDDDDDDDSNGHDTTHTENASIGLEAIIRNWMSVP